LRIAFVYDAVYPYVKGGAEKRYWELAKRLSKKHEVHIYGMKFWNGDDIIKRGGVYFHGVCEPVNLYTKGGRRSIWQAVYFALRLFPVLMKEKFDVIDCGNFPFFHCFTTYLVSSIKKTPLIVTWHEYWGGYWYEYLGALGFFGSIVERLATKIGDKVIAVSRLTENKLEENGVDSSRMIVIPNGIDMDLIKRIKPSKKGYDVLFVGRLIKDKNVDILVKAVAKTSNIRCGIIGKGPEEESLKKMAYDLGLSKRIDFLGFLESDREVYSYMKSSKVLALPSTREGFGIAALEANACGIPVVTTRHENNAVLELIKEGVNGFVIEGDADSYSKKFEEVINIHKDLSQKCIKEARLYEWGRLTKKIEGVYEDYA